MSPWQILNLSGVKIFLIFLFTQLESLNFLDEIPEILGLKQYFRFLYSQVHARSKSRFSLKSRFGNPE
jgi:hypothetical protein